MVPEEKAKANNNRRFWWRRKGCRRKKNERRVRGGVKATVHQEGGWGGDSCTFIELAEVLGQNKNTKSGEKYGNQLLFFFSAFTSKSPHCTSSNLPHERPYLLHFLSPPSCCPPPSCAALSNSATLRPIQCSFTVLWSSSTPKREPMSSLNL